MQIKSVTRLREPSHLVDYVHGDYVQLKFLEGCGFPSLFWPYDTGTQGPQAAAKRNSGRWDPDNRAWTFPDAASAYKVLDSIKKRHPDWPVLGERNHIHRVGQKSNCQVIQLMAKLPPSMFNLDDMMVELLGSKRALIGSVLHEDPENIVSAGMKSAVQQRLLSSWQPTTMNDPAVTTSSDAEPVPVPVQTPSPATEQAPAQRKRGRPKKYSDAVPPPSATDRSKQSIKALTERGGRRVMLHLEGEANAALEAIMALTGAEETTATINQAIVEWHRHLLKASTKNQHETLV